MQALKFKTDIIGNTIQIPDKFLKCVDSHHIEVIMIYNENNKMNRKIKPLKSLAGSLKQYANPSLIKTEKDYAWAQVATDKK